MKNVVNLIAQGLGIGSVDAPPGAISSDPKAGDSIIRNGFNVAIILGGVVAVGMIIYAGYKYMMGTDPGKIKEAQGMLTNAILGLVLVLAAFVIAEFIASLLGAESIFTNSPFTP